MTDPLWTERPACPFCGVAWSADMMDQYDRMSAGSGCACCAGPAGHTHAPANAPPVVSAPASDLCCSSCGKAIFRVA